MKLFVIIFLLFISQPSFADAWDNLSLQEAEAVVKELEQNPYIFDYCDCCDNKGEYASSIQFLKVVSSEIVPCSWDENFYSVKIETIVLCNVFYANDGADVTKLLKPEAQENATFIYMNYTWTFDYENKLAVPFFKVVPYATYDEDPKACKSTFAYPTPQQLSKVSKDKGYKKWYAKAMY